ncbi:putative RNA methyltransferase pc1544 [Neochlamydia sp. AcF65]|uniref:23S rRNA (uracil(1939)-C(5))-methyltransferase RlmD n=1 Tax=Neochlamydia sp. AcF65 TaxID=2795735 RepID=UPI001BCA595B|nr:23S rRNA (uracil(1939)-C(5))-methyltransferase RlmD [Neochlamydia sp. AcF65]MBS4165141.1 putative RNA methyltransferase pc1544 [Neochlamydia sp. AcF65]
MPYSKQTRFANVKINEFSKRGHGLGRIERSEEEIKEAEIAFAIPGDAVHSVLHSRNKAHWVGGIQRIIEPSKDRIIPKCIHFGSCGGCQWQQMSYDTQLRYKESLAKDIFRSVITPETHLFPIMPSESEWNYRNKMDFTFSRDLNKTKYLGLILDSTKGKVFNLVECHLPNSWFTQAVHAVKSWWEESNLEAYYPIKNTGSLRSLTLREGMKTGDRMVMLTVSGNPDYALQNCHLESFVHALHTAIEPQQSDAKLSIFVRIQQISPGMATNFYEMLLYGPQYIEEELDIQADVEKPAVTYKFRISPSSFFQPNIRQIEKVYSLALQLAKVNKEDIIYDLFCGSGVLGICASKNVKQVIGIEISPETAFDARQNAALNNRQNVTIISGAVRYALGQIQDENLFPLPDLVLLNPPRAGLDPLTMKHLLRLNAPKILYISGNPQAHVANIAELSQNGYTVKYIQPYDQFPQTIHVDSLILLEKTPSNI